MSNHTTGPWYTRHGQISSEASVHGCTIADCNATAKGISDEEVAANARLIAAAPDMLAALEGCVAFLCAWAVEGLNSKVKRETLCRAFGGQAYHVRAVIAKAKGEG